MSLVVEEIFSEDRLLKVEIRRRADGNLQLFAMRWSEDPEYSHASRWVPTHSYVTITDSLERARERAEELLREQP